MKLLATLKENIYVHIAALTATVFLIYGKAVPYSNEYSYLPRLVKTYRPDFLLNDLTFASPGNEHWLFNHLFGLLTHFLSIEVIGWGGRISCWLVILYALIKIGRHWKIPLSMISGSLFLWMISGQSLVADEWMIGGFEAKCVAYICLLFALDGFCKGREIVPAVLLGFTFSFHPAVGLWGIPAAILSLAVFRWDFFRVVKISLISGMFSLFGLIPLLSTEIVNSANSFEDWKYYVLVGYPFHVDPFAWARTSIVLMVLIAVFCFLFYRRSRGEKADNTLKFFIAFLLILFSFFCAGLLLRGMAQYELLRLMPMRLFSVFAPLFFLFTFAKGYQQKVFAPPANVLMVIGFICLLLWTNPAATGYQHAVETVSSRRQGTDDAAKSFSWIKEHTPRGTVVIAPPWRADFWYLSERAQIVNYGYAPVSDIGEWRKRQDLLLGERPLENGVRDPKEMAAFYNNMSEPDIRGIAASYHAGYLVSEGNYSFDIVFESGNYKVYRLKPQ